MMNVESSRAAGYEVLMLLMLLVEYKRQDGNPYVVKLSILDDELALNGYDMMWTVLTHCTYSAPAVLQNLYYTHYGDFVVNVGPCPRIYRATLPDP